MKKLETVKIIKKWATEYGYSLKDINFTQNGRWLIIDVDAVTIIIGETNKLIEDIKDYFNYATLYSIDIMPDDKGMSIWIEL